MSIESAKASREKREAAGECQVALWLPKEVVTAMDEKRGTRSRAEIVAEAIWRLVPEIERIPDDTAKAMAKLTSWVEDPADRALVAVAIRFTGKPPYQLREHLKNHIGLRWTGYDFAGQVERRFLKLLGEVAKAHNGTLSLPKGV